MDIKLEKPHCLWLLKFDVHSPPSELHRLQRSHAMSTPEILTFMSTALPAVIKSHARCPPTTSSTSFAATAVCIVDQL